MRVLRRVVALLALPRPDAGVAGGRAGRAGAPGPAEPSAKRGAPVSRPRPRDLPVPGRDAGTGARARRGRPPGRTLTGGAAVPDVRSDGASAGPPRRGTAGGRGARRPPLGGRHLDPAHRAAPRADRGGRRAPDPGPQTGARPSILGGEGSCRSPVPS